MTALNSYSTGTASVSAGGTTITGSGTIWSGTNIKPGDIFQIGNFQSVISDVTDTTHLVIPPWGGGAQTGVAYTIWQVSPQRFAGAEAMATVNQLVAAFRTSGFFVFVDIDATEPDPSLGDDGQYAFQPTTGKTWVKSAGVWAYLGIYKGFNFTGAYNGSTTYSVGDVMTDAGSSYVWINATPGSGHTAPNATYWQLLASKGDTGSTGPTGAGYGGTSTTSLAIGTGSKAFTTQAGLAYTNGARVRASSAANPTTDWMEGVATYSGTSLTISVDKTNGSGTHADWNFNVGGEPGTVGVSSIAGNTGAFTLGAGLTNATNVLLVDPTYLRGFINGLFVTNDASTPNTVIDISAGACVSSDATTLMKLAAFTKNANAAWAVGTGNGSADGAASYTTLGASTWYAVYLIERTDTGVVDVLTSKSFSAPTLPTNYTKSRFIGAFRTDASSHILAMVVYDGGNVVMWKTLPALDVSTGSALGTTPQSSSLLVPPLNVEALVNIVGANTSATTAIYIYNTDLSTAAPATNASPLGSFVTAINARTGFKTSVQTSAGAISYVANNASTDLEVQTIGWRYSRSAY
ncbi:hypothetical protein SAMN05216573_10773 [Bradyrhizobium sp. Rc3b]|uniref:hypothetical protein n=1 Tax=Bradyrhizobium sp. Rc3b TaxID=1855322 RepID=UPI0008E6AA51|nr:hypothetical protein [Bradyrhizobium sp. Rc3b]SFN02519.1 hypothetical protein SAMN05216573_10773 [Bradyrhizobium sp. Rc3b]